MSKIIKSIEKFRSIQNGGQRSDVEFHEPLNRDLFAFSKVVRHGFPHGPTCMAFDPIQRLLAIANQCGTIQIFGRSGVKSVLKKIDQSVDQPVTQIQFLVNEGALISVTADNKIHLWNFRQKQPEVTQSLEFGSREPISCIFVPFQSKWLYVGSEKGNVFIVSIETFALSGYDIKWNRAVGVGQPTHPGGVIHLSDAPWDDNKLLIGFEKGTIVLWDLKEKMGERFQCEQYVRSISWMYEGKQFVCSHPDGSLSLWNIKTPEKAERIWMPHYKKPSPTDSDKENNRIERCKPVNKIEWKHFRNGDEIMVFYDGTIMSDPKNKHIEPCPCVTVQKGKSTCVLQMEYPIVTFLTLCESPYATEPQEPYAVAVLLKNDLVLVDLTSTSYNNNIFFYPSFENPYQMDIAESPVTFCKYVADFPSQFVYELFTSQPKIKNNKNVSSKPWPITGGKGSVFAESYHELIITGHLDGTLKFWEAPGLTLQILYKLKTAKHFEKPDDVDHAAIIGSFPDGTAQSVFENLFAVEEISFCIPSRTLAVAGRAGQVMVYRFSRTEKDPELITHLNVPMVYKLTEEDNYIVQVPLGDYGQVSSAKTADAKRQETIDVGNGPPSPATSEGSSSEFFYPVKVKGAAQKFNSGYHIDLVCITPWGSADTPESAKINVLCLNSSFGLLAYACQQGLAVIDYVQRCIVLSMSAASLYGSNDPYAHHRAAVNLKHGGSSFERQSTMDDQFDEPSGVSGQDRTEGSVSTPNTENARSNRSTNSTNSAGLANTIGSSSSCAESSNGSSAKSPKTTERVKSQGTKSKSTVTSASASAVTRNSRALMLKAKSFASSSGPPLSSSSLAHLPTEEDHQNLLCPTLSLLDRSKKFQQSASVDPPMSSGQQTTDLKPPPSEMTSGPSPPLSASMIPKGKLGFTFHRSQDKEFSHSRSNSIDDLESIRSEAVSLIQFHESCARKNESQMYPSIWIGTTAGSVMSWCIILPSCDCRLDEKVVLAPSGTIIQQKGGSVICQGLYSMNNQILQPIAVPSVPWENLSKSKPKNLKAAGGCSTSSDDCVAPWGDGAATPSSSGQQADSQYLVVCTETKLCCYGVPSMTCVNSVKTSDIGLDPHPSVILWKAELCKIQQIAYLACFCSNAHILALSLPSFRCVFDEKMLPHADLRVAKFTSFADCGIGVYMCTPSELQKFTMSVEMSRQLGDMMSEVFMAVESPPAPKPSFFKGFFAQTAALDREELFRPGSQPKSVATMVKSATGQSATGQLDGARGYAASSSNVVNDARDKLFERGDKLKDTEDATQRMMESANSLSNNARQMKEHFKKKWYQF